VEARAEEASKPKRTRTAKPKSETAEPHAEPKPKTTRKKKTELETEEGDS
jgi:hypothetical protein